MADEPNNPSSSILGSTASINAGSATEAVQAEQIKRLEAEKQQAASAPASGTSLSASELMQQSAMEAQARTDAATTRAAEFNALSSAVYPGSPLPPPARRSGFDAEAANARAASRPFVVSPSRASDTSFSAPAGAGSFFDAFAYDERVQAQNLVRAGNTAPAGGWDTAAAPSFATTGMNNASDPYSSRYGHPEAAFQNWSTDYKRSPSLDEASPSFRERMAGYAQPVSDRIASGYDAVQDAYTDFTKRANGPDIVRPSSVHPSSVHPSYSSYEEAEQAKADILSDARNLYTSRGEYDKIGKSGFQADIKAAEISQGLREAPGRGLAGRVANMREDFAEPYGKLNYGYALAQVGQESGQFYEKTNAGQYLTSEQKEAAAAGFLPGVGALAGTAIGSMIAPGVGSWVGGMIGGGVGAAAQGIVGANEEREQASREAAERLAASLGLAADSAASFKSQLEATGAPIQQLSQGLAALQAGGPGVGSAAVAGMARSALAQGENFAPITSSITRFLAEDPALAPLAQDYRSGQSAGELSRQQYQSLAGLAIAKGDAGTFNAAMLGASTAALNGDKVYQEAAKVKEQQSGWLDTAINWKDGFITGHNINVEAQNTMDARKKADTAQDGLDAQKYVSEFADINRGRQGLIDSGLNVKIGQAGLATAEASGGGAAALRRLAPGLSASYDAASAADQTLITTDTAMMNRLAPGDPTRGAFQTLINQARADQVGNPLAKAQLARTVFDAGLQENESAFGLDITGRQSGLTRGLLSGRRYDQLAGDEYGLTRSETARAGQLRRDAANPINDPARRDQMLAQATTLETQAAVSRHDFQQNIERQTLGGLDVRIAGAAQGAEQARSFGTAGDIYSAQGRELDALRSKLSELTGELRRGGLTVDEQRQKESELIQVRGQAVQVAAQQRDERIASSRGMAEDDVTLATAGIGRQIRQGGSAAVNVGAVNAAYDSTLAADRNAITQYAPGTRERKDAEARLASDAARKQDALDSLNVYDPSAATRLGDVEGQAKLRRAQTAFSLEEISPYRSGAPGSSPFTAALGLESALKGDLALQSRDQAAADLFRAGRQKAGQWDDVAEAGYAADKERRDQTVDSDRLRMGQVEHDRQFEMLRALPLMIAGGGGMQGVSSGVASFDALTAAFTPNVLQGSWGKPANIRGAALPGSSPGNAFDGFQSHAAGSASAPASLTTAIQGLAHAQNTQQLASIMQQVLQTLQRMETTGRQRMPSQAGPPPTGSSAASQSLSQSFNSNRPGQR